MEDKRFGQRFKECRIKLGLTQEQLAAIAKLSVGYIGKVEQGKIFPSYKNIVILLNCLKASADDVFCDAVEGSMAQRSSETIGDLNKLPMETRKNITEVVELLIQQYYAGQEKTDSEQIERPPKA